MLRSVHTKDIEYFSKLFWLKRKRNVQTLQVDDSTTSRVRSLLAIVTFKRTNGIPRSVISTHTSTRRAVAAFLRRCALCTGVNSVFGYSIRVSGSYCSASLLAGNTGLHTRATTIQLTRRLVRSPDRHPTRGRGYVCLCRQSRMAASPSFDSLLLITTPHESVPTSCKYNSLRGNPSSALICLAFH
jgi:hypothetical protein